MEVAALAHAIYMLVTTYEELSIILAIGLLIVAILNMKNKK